MRSVVNDDGDDGDDGANVDNDIVALMSTFEGAKMTQNWKKCIYAAERPFRSMFLAQYSFYFLA